MIHVSTGDRRGLRMRVRDDRFRDRGEQVGPVGFDRLAGLKRGPTVIPAAADEMHHLPQFPADVAAPQVALHAVETHPPRVAQAIGPEFGPRRRRAARGRGRRSRRRHPGIVRGHSVLVAGITTVDIDAQDRTFQITWILPRIVEIRRRRRPGIAGGDVEKTIRAEAQAASVVSTRAPRQQDLLARRIDAERL